jgi:hypothetical protein
MAFCSGCGKALEEGSRFCSGCGISASGIQTLGEDTAVARPARVIVVLPKRGGWLAFKGFIVASILAVGFAAATHDNTVTRALCMMLAFGSGAAYIVINLQQWKKNNEIIKGVGIGWAVVAFLLLGCLVNLPGAIGGNGTQSSTSAGNSPVNYPVTSPDPKRTLLQEVRLDFKWRKDGFGNVMIANFTLRNPTEYRFKDFEIKCTHSAPSGTVIDSNSRTVYEIVEPHSTKVIKEMNMGFINSQASSSDCVIADLVPLP